MEGSTAAGAWDPANYDAELYHAQLDEIVACTSILGADDFRLSDVVGLPSDQQHDLDPEALQAAEPPAAPARPVLDVAVHVQLPSSGVQLYIAGGLPGSCDGRDGRDSHEECDPGPSTSKAAEEAAAAAAAHEAEHGLPFGKPVSQLPPIRLHLELPYTYPASAPPRAQLAAMWLTPAEASQLAASLYSQFTPGEPCLFQWVDWLRTDALEQLGVASSGVLVIRDRILEFGGSRCGSACLDTAVAAAAASAACAAGAACGGVSLSSASQGAGSLGGTDTVSGPAAVSASRTSSQQPGRGEPSASQTSHASRGHSSGGSCAPATSCNHTEKSNGHASRPQHGPPESPLPPSAPGQAAQAASSPMVRALIAAQGHSNIQPAHEAAMAVLRYAHAREAEVFQTQSVTCAICFEDMVGAKCVRLPECGHYFCRPCFAQHCSTQVADGAVENVKCPEPSCRLPVTPVTLRSVLSEEEYERWEALLLQRTLDKMEDVVYCPRCNSIVLEEADHCAQCSECFFVFCALCYGSWHPGEECMSAEAKLEALQRRGQRQGVPNAERQRIEMDLINQIKSMGTILGTSKKCPKCQMGIQKTEGCNKMVCSYCSTFFCWKCLKVIDGYDHFGAKSCALFDEAEIARWNAMQNVGERYWEAQAANNVVDQVRRGAAGNMRVRFARCVICGQFNLKEGNNNLIRCYACTSAFCYLCRTHLPKNPGLHFGPGKKCKQHSED